MLRLQVVGWFFPCDIDTCIGYVRIFDNNNNNRGILKPLKTTVSPLGVDFARVKLTVFYTCCRQLDKRCSTNLQMVEWNMYLFVKAPSQSELINIQLRSLMLVKFHPLNDLNPFYQCRL